MNYRIKTTKHAQYNILRLNDAYTRNVAANGRRNS